MIPVSVSAYDRQLIYVLEQLRQCKFDDKSSMAGGSAIGHAGRPHEFYLLFPYVASLASHEDLIAMLRDQSPVVRIMAAKCILGKGYQFGDLKKEVDVLENDSTAIYVALVGCCITKETVAQVLKELKKDPHFLGDLRRPN